MVRIYSFKVKSKIGLLHSKDIPENNDLTESLNPILYWMHYSRPVLANTGGFTGSEVKVNR